MKRIVLFLIIIDKYIVFLYVIFIKTTNINNFINAKMFGNIKFHEDFFKFPHLFFYVYLRKISEN